MEKLIFDLNEHAGAFKVLNATNGGPWCKRHANDQYRTNFENYKAARFPYSRNHDSGVLPIYGGPYSHDITRIFPDFNADVNDPASYDFECTDESILIALDAGTETFFRLGQTIEHQIKKHGIFPPADYRKWAEICEHIIRHYNEGWSNGYSLNITYWEIWNEPDLDVYVTNPSEKRTWTGTKEEFFDFYEVAAKHLKKCFPHLKIGGPALAGRFEWADEFLDQMSKRNVPLDFFSWHGYCIDPDVYEKNAKLVHDMLVKYGYEHAESILNEWNYVKDWGAGYVDTLKDIHGIKGAAFTMACISTGQKSKYIDMMMYYDTRPSVFCGAFDFYTYEPLKGYYPLMWYGKFYDTEYEVKCKTEIKDVYTVCGVDKNGKTLTVVTYYNDNENAESKDIEIDFGRGGKYEIYLLDKEHDAQSMGVCDELKFKMNVNSCVLVEEK